LEEELALMEASHFDKQFLYNEPLHDEEQYAGNHTLSDGAQSDNGSRGAPFILHRKTSNI